jgi:hypothetical protein
MWLKRIDTSANFLAVLSYKSSQSITHSSSLPFPFPFPFPTQYLYPKEVFIANGILQPSISATKNVGVTKAPKQDSKGGVAGDGTNGGLNFVYPYGSTLNVARPATVKE